MIVGTGITEEATPGTEIGDVSPQQFVYIIMEILQVLVGILSNSSLLCDTTSTSFRGAFTHSHLLV